MKRGFITIATGKKHYYALAANLVKSYRTFTDNPYPFAIIAEEENEYTKFFDDVVLTTESTHSFLDKFLLMKLCPYDETIFFDADSLAYGDLNRYWNLFDGATDFSAIGVNVPRDQKEGAWYDVEGIGKYGKNLPYKVRVHAGVCFIRRAASLKKLYADCEEILLHYDELLFHTCPNSRDECTLGVAMPMNGMKATKEDPHMMAAYPCLTFVETDMIRGNLRYKAFWMNDIIEDGILLHWGTNQTFQPNYQFDVACLYYMANGGKRTILSRVLYEKRWLYHVLLARYQVERLWKKIKRVIKSRLSPIK